jgi:glycosyltransferase involved in cell wall biosynthesis
VRILITSIVDLERSAHNRLHEFVRYLSRRHEVIVISVKDWWKACQVDSGSYRRGLEDALRNIRIWHFTDAKVPPFLQELFSPFTLNRVLEGAGQSFDVHLNYNALISGSVVAKKLQRVGIGTVYDVADDLVAMVRESPQIPPVLRPLAGLMAKLLVRENIRVASKVTVSTNALDLPGLSRSKSVVILNGVDTTMFRKRDSGELRRRLGLDEAFVIGYVGVLREWVDLKPTLRALTKLRVVGHDVKLLVVGEEGGRRGLEDLAGELGISDQVVLVGTVPYPMVPWYISCMDVGLIPFKLTRISAGALPLKLFEYMACEVPVICSELPSVQGLLKKVVTFALDEDEIAHAVQRLLENREARRRLGAVGRQLVVENYEWARIVPQLEQVLCQVAAGGSKAACAPLSWKELAK